MFLTANIAQYESNFERSQKFFFLNPNICLLSLFYKTTRTYQMLTQCLHAFCTAFLQTILEIIADDMAFIPPKGVSAEKEFIYENFNTLHALLTCHFFLFWGAVYWNCNVNTTQIFHCRT